MNDKFLNMNREEAEKHFQLHLETQPKRLERFLQTVTKQGGPKREVLNFSPKSLVPLWEWFASQITTDGPPAKNASLPIWYGEEYGSYLLNKYDEAMLWRIDGLFCYFSECFIKNIKNVRWIIADKPKIKNYISQNKPVLSGFDDDLDALLITLTATNVAVVRPKRNIPELLFNYFNVWIKKATESTKK